MATINSTLEDIMKLDYTSREMLMEILQKRQIESRRNDIAKGAKKSLKEFQKGKITPLNASDLIHKLDSL